MSVAKNGHAIVPGLNAIERIPVLWEHLEELFPAFDHSLFALSDLPLAIDERVIVSHEKSESVEILIVNALVKLERD